MSLWMHFQGKKKKLRPYVALYPFHKLNGCMNEDRMLTRIECSVAHSTTIIRP